MKVREIKNYLNKLLDFNNCCEWDNCGLLVGDDDAEIKKAGFVLDLTKESLDDAKARGVNLIITHHPVIFHAQKTFTKGNIAYEAAAAGISVISCHTCYDSAENGVSEILAEKLGLSDIKIIETQEKPYCVRVGITDKITPEDLAEKVSAVLGTTVRLCKGNILIDTAAVCGGAGGDFISEVSSFGAQAYITGDISHHEFLLAQELGLTVIAAGHFETEVISIEPLMNYVKAEFPTLECLLLSQANPVTFVSAEDK